MSFEVCTFYFRVDSSSSFLVARLITKTFHLQQQRRRQRPIFSIFFLSFFYTHTHTHIRSLSPEFPLAWKCSIHNNNNNRNKNYKLRTSANNHSQSAHAFFLKLQIYFFSLKLNCLLISYTERILFYFFLWLPSFDLCVCERPKLYYIQYKNQNVAVMSSWSSTKKKCKNENRKKKWKKWRRTTCVLGYTHTHTQTVRHTVRVSEWEIAIEWARYHHHTHTHMHTCIYSAFEDTRSRAALQHHTHLYVNVNLCECSCIIQLGTQLNPEWNACLT